MARKGKAEKASEDAPEVTIASLAGLVESFAGSISAGMEAMGERIAKLETAKPATGKATPKAKAEPKVAIPHTAVLGALKGECNLGQQTRAEANYAKGRVTLKAYIADRLTASSRAQRYSQGLLDAMPEDGPKTG